MLYVGSPEFGKSRAAHFGKLLRNVFFLICAGTAAGATDADFAPLCGKTVRVAVRTDAPPFGYAVSQARPEDACTRPGRSLDGFAGFTVSLCRGFLDAAQESCGDDNPITIRTEPVPISERAAWLAAEEGEIDLLCGATTATVTRRALLPSSPYTFLTGTAIVLNRSAFATAPSASAGSSCRVGVVAGTTAAAEGRFSSTEIRLPGWEAFAKAHGCQISDLDMRKRHDYADTGEALADLSQDDPDSRKADLLIDDLHILHWYLDNFAVAVAPAESAGAETADQRRSRLKLQRDILSIEPYALVASRPTAQGGRADGPGYGVTVAAFSRYLTDLQAGKQTIGGTGYVGLLRACFGRRIDRNLWSLIELQANTRKGEFPGTLRGDAAATSE